LEMVTYLMVQYEIQNFILTMSGPKVRFKHGISLSGGSPPDTKEFVEVKRLFHSMWD